MKQADTNPAFALHLTRTSAPRKWGLGGGLKLVEKRKVRERERERWVKEVVNELEQKRRN